MGLSMLLFYEVTYGASNGFRDRDIPMDVFGAEVRVEV